MRKVEAVCPSCGGPVEFKVGSSLVTVCPFCNSLVARGDRALEDLGKVAALVDTNSPLELGATGRLQDKPFELVGHVQYRHAAGGVWDEWYAAFPGDRYGWLAEAQGKFHLTFEQKKSAVPNLEGMEFKVGDSIEVPKFGTLVVHEKSSARLIAAAGELPIWPDANMPHTFADLSGEQGAFATIDLDAATPRLFVGRQVTLEELGISRKVAEERDPKEISSTGLPCPNCGGGLDLKAPDKSERVTCPFCDALLDIDQGNLKYLSTLKKRQVEPEIPLGTIGTLRGREFTVIGFLRRSVTYEGRPYYWTEYLLYHARDGFFWLVNSEGHWNFVESVPRGEIKPGGENCIRYQGEEFKLYQSAIATVRDVLGEFYWKVEVGEMVDSSDYIKPPRMISVESTWTRTTELSNESGVAHQETNVSLGIYVPREEIAAAFKLPAFKPTFGVSPNQPNPSDPKIYFAWPLMIGAIVLVYFLFRLVRSADAIEPAWFWISLVLVSLYPLGTFLYRSDFERRRWAESDYSPYTTE